VAEMADRHADSADFALGKRMIAVVAGLRRQIEGDREPGLPLAQVGAVKRVGGRGRRVPRIGAENPRLVAARLVARWLISRCLFAARLAAHRYPASLHERPARLVWLRCLCIATLTFA